MPVAQAGRGARGFKIRCRRQHPGVQARPLKAAGALRSSGVLIYTRNYDRDINATFASRLSTIIRQPEFDPVFDFIQLISTPLAFSGNLC